MSEYTIYRLKCKKCGAPLIFAKTSTGKSMPFNVKKTIILVNGKICSGNVTHFATCPYAKEFSKKNKRILQ